ncbi:MAG: hypothetical protein Q7S88_01135 [Candidatus Daviesbacteria bacterium]|nr:hypothetical protein [Candidatus Daviesbacteria bacterium]
MTKNQTNTTARRVSLGAAGLAAAAGVVAAGAAMMNKDTRDKLTDMAAGAIDAIKQSGEEARDQVEEKVGKTLRK